MNVYDHKTNAGTPCKGVTEKDDPQCFLLVGGFREAEGKTRLGSVQLHGWVRAKDVALWPSAISVYYKEGIQDVKIFTDEAAARQAARLWGLFPPAENLVLAVKKDRHNEPKGHNIPRFPVIDNLAFSKDKFIYQIVIAGDVCPASDRRCVEAPDKIISREGEGALIERNRVGQGILRSKGLDVLLVIDGTESMDRYYGAIIQAVEEVSKQAVTENLKVRFAAATFGDYKGASTEPSQVMMKWPARFSPDASALRGLSRGLVGPDPHRDLPEAPFAAIIHALDTVKDQWAADSAFRVVIWIGDHSNRPKGQHQTAGGFTITENFSEEEVAASLLAAKANFGAIQVRGKYDAEHNGRMVTSAKKIAATLTLSYKNPFDVISADLSPKATDAEIKDAIRKKLYEHIMQGDLLEKHASPLSSGCRRLI